MNEPRDITGGVLTRGCANKGGVLTVSMSARESEQTPAGLQGGVITRGVLTHERYRYETRVFFSIIT